MTNFTQEYIELCNNEKVQGLRPKLKHGDWYTFIGGKVCLRDDYFTLTYCRDHYIWLPYRELDDEIIKILDNFKRKAIARRSVDCFDTPKYHLPYWVDYREIGGVCPNKHWRVSVSEGVYEFKDSNPLIAKIKLLIKLLEEQ